MTKTLLKYAMCALIAAHAACETWGVSVAPVNPAFLRWQKERKNKKATSQSTNMQSRASLLSVSGAESSEENLDFGLIPEPFDSSYLANLNTGLDCGVQDAMPSKYDLRTTGCLTPVKNQGSYGTCWAHATLGSVESNIKNEEGVTYDFSENNMANLHGWDWGFNDGGNATISSAYLLRWAGPVLEGIDPYPNPGRSTTKTPARHVQRVRWVPGRTYYLDLDNIKSALMECGALHVSYYHSDSYYNYSKASYYKNDDDGTRRSNHAVALVGWDDDYPRSNFKKQPPDNGAFIVRNSWGTNWGDGGYFYVSYYDESFAWKTLYGFPCVESADNYDGIYQYDPLGMYGGIGYGSTTAWGAAIFSATSGSQITAVGFYALTPSTSYSIYVYTGCSASSPRSGTLQCEQIGKTDAAGFATVPLHNPPSISIGTRFSIVLKLTTPGYKNPLAYEYAEPGYTSDATASGGETFLSANGNNWSDFTEVHGSASFCCKAYTKSAAMVKSLSSVAISGVSSIKSGASATFTCKAKYSDGSEKDVTPVWSVTSGGAYASVSSSGIVTAKSATSQQAVKVQASYTEGNVTKTGSWSFYVTVAPPKAPAGLTATQGDESSCVRLVWTAVDGATSYAVYRGTTASSGNAQYLGDVTSAKYADTEASPGVKYYYFVKAKNSSGSSLHSAGAQGWRGLSTPLDVVASDGSSLECVEVTWTSVTGAKYYRVYRSETEGGEKTALGSWQTATDYRDTTAVVGIVYRYYVVAAIDARGSMASDYSVFDDGYRKEPVALASIGIVGAASVASGESATYSCTATMTDGTVKSVTPSWSISSGSAYATVSGGWVTAKTVTANQSVVIAASYSEGGVTKSATKPITVTAVKPSAPIGLAVVSQTSDGIALSWAAVSGAVSYRIYRSVAGGAASVCGTVATARFTDSTVTPGVSCTYWVSAVNGAGESDLSASSVTGMIPLGAPVGVRATVDRTDGVSVSWSALAGAMHYRVSRATSATGAKTDLGAWQTGSAYVDTSAVSGTEYWYFVRAATSSSGANASAYSAGVQGLRKVAVTLSSITILGGANTVAAGGSLVFSCTATYSDGTKKTVRPTWSVSPSATASIDGNGVFKAGYMTENSSVTVTARYTDGTTKTATRTVAVIAPLPTNPTVTVSGISTKPRWPFSGLVDIDYNVSVDPEGTKATVSVSGYDLDRNVPLVAKTLTGDGATAPVEAGGHRITWNVAADHPGFHAAAFSVTVEVAVASIAAPSGLVASQGTSTDNVTLSWDAVSGAASYEIWRGTSNNSSSAEQIGTSDSASYIDEVAVPGVAYYYWVKSVAPYGTSDFVVEGIAGRRMISAPTNVSATDGTSTVKVTVAWDAVDGAISYEIWRGVNNNNSSMTRIGTSTSTSFFDTDAMAGTTYYYRVKAVASVDISAFSSSDSGYKKVVTHDKVQLWEGGPYWATTNIGAENPEDYGYYFWWGDTVGYKRENDKWVASDGSNSNFSFDEGNTPTDNKSISTLQSEGWITSDGVLAPEHDAAHVQWGGVWRMPTAQELEDLNSKCSWSQTSMNGVNGWIVRGKGDYSAKSIFLPLSGNGRGTLLKEAGSFGSIWSSNRYGSWAYYLPFDLSYNYMCSYDRRYYGRPVRPVRGDVVPSSPTNVSATDGTSTDNVTVTWDAVTIATSYEIWRNTGNSSSFATKIGTSTSTSYSDASAISGTIYYYWVKAVSSVGTSKFSSSDIGYKAPDKIQLWKGGPYWATKNIGAENPVDYGYYFWWGDTIGYKRENGEWVASDGSSLNFSFIDSNALTCGKYRSTLRNEGWLTADLVLAPGHDAAQKHWGGDWRMPTRQEFKDLIDNCDWVWTSINSIAGYYVVRGRGDYASNSMILPCAGFGDGTSLRNSGGCGYYWSSDAYPDDYYAYRLGFTEGYPYTDDNFRSHGLSVRPVAGDAK